MDENRSNRTGHQADEPAPSRRALWSRRIATAVLVLFVAFLVLNVAVVLALILRNLGPGGGPFGG
ncbi:MAG TPA: hypothetical protein VFV72_14455 [Candidatus Limnocylindrales bacterium]|nr:hypothetical protein [Candidatus Limnocylindrales bacterium]